MNTLLKQIFLISLVSEFHGKWKILEYMGYFFYPFWKNLAKNK